MVRGRGEDGERGRGERMVRERGGEDGERERGGITVCARYQFTVKLSDLPSCTVFIRN